jgi:hypothetical protein
MIGVGAARRPAFGESVCGDAYWVGRAPAGVLVALVDGLGHGVEAAEAAEVFCAYTERNAQAPVGDILVGASRELARTRGAVAALARIDLAARVLEFAGVGNIGVKVQARRAFAAFSCPGMLGRPLRQVRSFRFELADGDLVVLHSDGLRAPLDLEPHATGDLDALASALVEAHGTHDDASCVVIRFGAARGEPRRHD